jgi:ppGpp synthetase/RelA/SpoT-type nucleotidyltranferase
MPPDEHSEPAAFDERDSWAPPTAVDLGSMLAELQEATNTDFASLETAYDSLVARSVLAVQQSPFYDRLAALHERLADERIAQKIRAIESWANGESEFRIVGKSWASVIDKLYRINKEENRLFANPPIVPTLGERARQEDAALQRWITPEIAHEVVDDLLRTKFVVPFVDGVVSVGDDIVSALDETGLLRFKRFHAKDTGYHARHYYALIPVEGDGERVPDTTVALEVKVLTKMQDQLGELTHILYEKHRTGSIKLELKRKLAWQLGTPDFLAAYLGHSGHFLEAAICDLKTAVLDIDGAANGQS